MEEITNKDHVLVLPFPMQGHINPMVQFSKRLASSGVKVTILIIESICKNMPKASGSINIESIPHDDSPPENIDKSFEWFHVLVSKTLTKIIEKLSYSEYPVKVLVYDSISTWAIDIAHQLGLKGAAFFTQSCSISAIYYHMDPEISKIPLDGSVVSLPSLPLLEKEELPSFICEIDLYPAIKELVFSQNINFKKADWLFFNTFDVLEKEVVDWMRTKYPIKTIGPTIPSMYLDKRLKEDEEYGLSLFKPNDEVCMKWLDSRETAGSVVYISFGSLATLGEIQMEELASGLMTSNCYFLWVVRATEENKLPKESMSKLSEKGLVVKWCPQLDVLAHRAVGCFFTHCGWNSTLEALSLGVPMVAMPHWSDQPTNAKFISDVWQTGIRVKAGENGVVYRDEIAHSIREVMEEKKGIMLKENATKWKILAKEAVDEGGSSDKNIEEFVSSIM
ncbi:UDP-glycosyltransferase 74E2 [Capsicum galapagoense]